MRIFRIADGRYPLWSGAGAMLFGGRWNSPGKPVIYGSLSFAAAMLEVLVHAGLDRLPRTHVYVVAEAPDDITVERLDREQLAPDWRSGESRFACKFGDQWINEGRSAVLLVPSAV